MNEVCKPNISAAGRRRRMRVGYGGVVASVALLVTGVALHWPWYVRAVVFFPAALSAIGFLQATRHTCIARAAEGTFEHDDFSTTKADDAEVAASRKVAASIKRDALLVGLVCAVIACATALS
ncbi:MAG TPA: hypothetical protein VGH28_14960 [Polyangiaceae bacterium]|jgi:hypothetical protein